MGKHDYRFIDGVEPARYDEVLTLGPEAPWYVALHFSRAGRTAEARSMLAVGVSNSPDPFKSLCSLELTRIGTAAERLASVEALLADEARDASIKASSLKSLRVDLLVELRRFGDISDGFPAWFYAHPVSERMSAALTDMPAGYPQLFYDIATSRLQVYRREYQGAWIGAKAVLANGKPECFQRAVLSDFGKAALYGSTGLSADAAFFDQLLAANKYPQSGYLLSFYAGRLYVAAGANAAAGTKTAQRLKETARKRFASAMILAANDDDYDNALWYLLDISAKTGMDQIFTDIGRYARNWKNPAGFADLLDSLIVQLAGSGDWKRIVELRRILPENTDREIRTRLDYLAARSGILGDTETKDAFTAAFTGDHSSLYYRALSAQALGIALGSPESVVVKKKKNGDVPAAVESDVSVLRGYLTYQLPELLYPTAVKRFPELPVAAAMELSSALSDAGLHGDALRLMTLALRATDTPITDDDLKLIYPRPWLDEVSAAAKRFDVPEYLLYALMRTESYFQSDVVSSAGAVGLTQLMKPTAGDIARKLKMDEFDLTDPGTNITFGAYYLSELASRLDGRILPALFAYNAGISRVRGWQKTSGDLPLDLFLETLPYGETREYGRKVLAASAVYGYLYYQKTIGQTVRESF